MLCKLLLKVSSNDVCCLCSNWKEDKVESSSRFDFSEGKLERADFNYQSDIVLWTTGIFFNIMDVNIADRKKRLEMNTGQTFSYQIFYNLCIQNTSI